MLLISIVAAIIIFLVFLAIYNAMNAGSVQISQRVRRIGEINRQRALSGGNGGFWDDFNSSRVSSWARAGADRFGRFFPKRAWFDLQVERAALPVTGGEYATITFFGGLFWFFMMLIVNGSIVRSAVICVAWWLCASFYLYNLGQKRMKAFNAQLGDAIVMMSNAVKAGFTFQQAMDIVSKEMNDPISGEFTRAINEVQLGVPLEDALNGISKRITSDDFDLVATAVIIQRQVGGNLTHILDTVGMTIRERIKLNGEIKSLTAEGILSGWIIGLLPIALGGFFLMLDPHYFDEFLQSSFGKKLVIVAIISEILGGLIIKKIVNVRI